MVLCFKNLDETLKYIDETEEVNAKREDDFWYIFCCTLTFLETVFIMTCIIIFAKFSADFLVNIL